MYQDVKQNISFIIENIRADNLDSFLVSQYIQNDGTSVADGEFPGDLNFYEEETHKFPEAALVLEGSFILHMNHNYHIIHKNQICLIDREVSHRIGWKQPDSGNLSILWIACMGKILRLHKTLYNPNRALKQSGCDLFNMDDSLLDEIRDELKEKQPGYREAVVSFLTAYLTLVLRKLSHSVASRGEDWKARIISETKAFIINNLDSKLSLLEISNAVSISPSYLSLLFKQVTGCNLSDYILDLRINKAMDLLVSTSHRLSDIARMVGFYDQFYLSKVFKQYTGMSPSKFRKQSRQSY